MAATNHPLKVRIMDVCVCAQMARHFIACPIHGGVMINQQQ
jgi:hypothetical protein